MNYQLIHDNIIERAKNRPNKGYVELHHIVPTCILGKQDNSEENLVYLTAREHFIIHKLLTLIYPNENGLHLAVFAMSNGWKSKFNKREYRISSREYKTIRENAALAISKINKKRYEDPKERDKTALLSKKMWKNPDHVKKMSDVMKGVWANPEYKDKLSQIQLRRYEDPEERDKTSEATKKHYEDPVNREVLSNIMKERWKDPVYFDKMTEASSGKNNGMSKQVKLTMNDGSIHVYDTMVAVRNALGFKSYNPIYKALKNNGMHPIFGWTVELEK